MPYSCWGVAAAADDDDDFVVFDMIMMMMKLLLMIKMMMMNYNDIYAKKQNYPTHPGGHVFNTQIENASYIHIEKTAPSPGGHVFPLITTIFKLIQYINKTNVLTRPPPGGHVFSLIMTIFKLVRDIYKIDAKIVTSKEKDPPSPGGHVFLPIQTIFKLNRHLTKNVNSRTIFELVRDINETNVLNKLHDDWAKSVTSRVFTWNTAPPPGGHVFQWTKTFFELNHHIIKTNILKKLHEDWASNVTSTVTNLLTKFHEDRTINVASRVFTRQMLTTDGRRTKGDHKSSP
ncbi:hypothetical protein DPMN_122001 [Dreissena polymorpha]|uniref:Uncharacterized protein n=1 Tax=Dreissena polymorpha TaxID=45954 RepID=A0A9D4GRP0_DREPO|nr:hypothetical protein DPMN_122001 [Dreissena polymorpha]